MGDRPCKTCRWVKVGLLEWLFRDYSGARCVNPTVLANLHLATRQGMHVMDFAASYNGVVEADPVSGRPEIRTIVCSDVRRQQTRIAPGTKFSRSPATDEERAVSNCGPEGRYWEPAR